MSTHQKPVTPETLPFLFTPVGVANENQTSENPHSKKTTRIPEVLEAIRQQFGEAVLAVTEYAGEITVLVAPDRLIEIVQFLKQEQAFDYLSDLGGIDRFTEDDRYEIVYNLASISEGKRIRLKIRVDESTMEAPSLTTVYRAANWNERECYDMFGIRFSGHPDMRRMFMPEDFEYHPLRKEFPLLGIPGSLPLPPQSPEAGLTMDPFAAAHGSKPVKSFDEEASQEDFD